MRLFLWDSEIKVTLCACITFVDDFLSEVLDIVKHGIAFAVLARWMQRCPLMELHTLFLCSRSLLFRHLPEWCILRFMRQESPASLFPCMLGTYCGVLCNLHTLLFCVCMHLRACIWVTNKGSFTQLKRVFGEGGRKRTLLCVEICAHVKYPRWWAPLWCRCSFGA